MSNQQAARRDETRQEGLLDQKDALWEYLDALLSEVPGDDRPDAVPSEPEPVREAPQPPAAEEPAGPIPGWDAPEPDAPQAPPAAADSAPAKSREAPEREIPVTAEPEPEMARDEVAETSPAEPEPAAESRPEPDGPPEWAYPDFQALMFSVGGLKLAVPLVKLHSVLPWSESISGMPNQPHWCHGLMHYRGRNVRVVDTARLVLPTEKLAELEEETPEKILVVGDGRWAMSCSQVSDVIRIKPSEVKWRGAEGRRKWLAGTVRDRLCAIMDTEAFAEMLDQA